MLSRRNLLATAAASAAVPAIGRAAGARDDQLRRTFDLIEAGLKPRDQTPVGAEAARRAAIDGLAAVEAFNSAGLSPTARLDWQAVKDGLGVEAALARRFPFGGVGASPTPYVLTHRSGAYQEAAALLRGQPRAGAAEALTRDIEGQTERLRGDAALGVVPPPAVLEATIKAVSASAAKAAGAPNLRAALERQVGALVGLRAQARPGDGVWRLKDGEAYYALALQNAFGKAVDPHAAHRRVLDAAHALRARADVLLRGRGLTQGSVAERLRALARDPKFLYADDSAGRDQAVADMNARLAAIVPRLPQAFGDLPIPHAEVRRMSPADEARARAGYREMPAAGADGVGAYYVDLSNIRGRPSWTLPSVAHHELLPGHLVQLPLQEAAHPHPLRLRYAGAYAEAWATYAEGLAGDLGAFADDPLGEIGALQWRLFRLGRAVADTGIHAERWSRERAVAEVRELQGESIAFITIEADVERMLFSPGQVAGQGLGALEFARLRAGAKGVGLAAFHRSVLNDGPWPFGVLPQIVRPRR